MNKIEFIIKDWKRKRESGYFWNELFKTDEKKQTDWLRKRFQEMYELGRDEGMDLQFKATNDLTLRSGKQQLIKEIEEWAHINSHEVEEGDFIWLKDLLTKLKEIK